MLQNAVGERALTSDGVGVEIRRIRKFPFSSESAYDSIAYDPVKTKLSESQAEAEGQTNDSSHAFSVLHF